MRPQQRQFHSFIEGPALLNVDRLGNRKQRLDRIHAADQVMVLRRRAERRQILPSEREKNIPRRRTQNPHGICRVLYFNPPIAVDGGPRRALQGEYGGMHLTRRTESVSGNCSRVRMSGIDQCDHVVVPQIPGETRDPAKASPPHGHGVCRGRCRAAGHRQGDVDVRARGETLGEQSRFGGASQNQDVISHVVR